MRSFAVVAGIALLCSVGPAQGLQIGTTAGSVNASPQGLVNGVQNLPVVNAVAGAAAPAVNAVEGAAAPVVNTVEGAAAPVVNTVEGAAGSVVNTVNGVTGGSIGLRKHRRSAHARSVHATAQKCVSTASTSAAPVFDNISSLVSGVNAGNVVATAQQIAPQLQQVSTILTTLQSSVSSIGVTQGQVNTQAVAQTVTTFLQDYANTVSSVEQLVVSFPAAGATLTPLLNTLNPQLATALTTLNGVVANLLTVVAPVIASTPLASVLTGLLSSVPGLPLGL